MRSNLAKFIVTGGVWTGYRRLMPRPGRAIQAKNSLLVTPFFSRTSLLRDGDASCIRLD